jgi:hypothetical protein
MDLRARGLRPRPGMTTGSMKEIDMPAYWVARSRILDPVE